MNPFRMRSKAPVTDPDSHHNIAYPLASAPESIPQRSYGFKKRSKQATIHTEIDLSAALPPTDNFRTSLLMPKLSARFSMLREMNDGANTGCSVQKETSGQHWFATHMDADDEKSHGGKIMDRAQPRRRNKLFGGRQKIYRMVTRGSNGETSNRHGFGRSFYEDDVRSTTLFPRPKKRRNLSKASSSQPPVTPNGGSPPQHCHDLPDKNSIPSDSPSSANSSRRDFSGASSTEQSPSFSKCSPDKNKRKRLYDQCFDRQGLGNNTSVRSRLEQRFRMFPRSREDCEPQDVTKVQKKFAEMSMHTTSKGPAETSTVTNGEESSSPLPKAIVNFCSSSPQSNLAVDPKDVGKATASGAFQKPQKPYDEEEFAERQIQLQESRTKSPLTSPARHRNRNFVIRPDEPQNPPVGPSPSPNRHFRIHGVSELEQGSTRLAKIGGMESDASILGTRLTYQPIQTRLDDRSPSIFEPDNGTRLENRCADLFDSRLNPRKSSRRIGDILPSHQTSDHYPQKPALLSSWQEKEATQSDLELGDMVRKHLRGKSNASSLYPGSVAGHEDLPPVPHHLHQLALPIEIT